MNIDCPQCGTRLRPELTHCLGCGWKIRLSQILVQPHAVEKPAFSLPASDVYYLFADHFLEPVAGDPEIHHVEHLISDRSPVRKESLVLGLCRVSFIWLAVSGHVDLQLLAKPLTIARARCVNVVPKGMYKVPAGSLEGRFLECIYDRRQGFPVEDTMRKMMGFWYQGDAYNWILQIVKQHLLASPCAPGGTRIDAQQLSRLKPQVETVKTMLNSFAVAQPTLVAALLESIQRGLDNKKGMK
jgi:hypothetical protein